MTTTQNLNQTSSANEATTTEQAGLPPMPSFDELWANELRSLGFSVEGEGSVQYNAEAPTPPAPNPSEAEGGQSAAPAPRPAYITATLEAVINHEIQKVLAEDPFLNQGNIPQATREYLKNLAPEYITPETVRAALYMFFGNYASKRLQYEQKVAERSYNPKDAIPNPIKQKAQQYADIWGIDPNELMDEYLKEVSKRNE